MIGSTIDVGISHSSADEAWERAFNAAAEAGAGYDDAIAAADAARAEAVRREISLAYADEIDPDVDADMAAFNDIGDGNFTDAARAAAEADWAAHVKAAERRHAERHATLRWRHVADAASQAAFTNELAARLADDSSNEGLQLAALLTLAA